MLPKEHRLRHEKDIKALFAKGKSVFGVSLGLKLVPNNLETSRFTVVVGVKTAKKAVDRNRIKRRVRSLVHKYIQDLKAGFDVVVLPKQTALTQGAKELEDDFVKLCKKAKLL